MSGRKPFLRHKKYLPGEMSPTKKRYCGILISGFGDKHHRLRDSKKLGMLMWIVLMAASVGNHFLFSEQSPGCNTIAFVPTPGARRYLQSSLSFQNREIMHLVPWHVSLRDISCTLSSGHRFKPVNLPATLWCYCWISQQKPPMKDVPGWDIMSYSESQGALYIITPLSIFALQMVDSVVLSGMLAPCHKNYASIVFLVRPLLWPTTEGAKKVHPVE